MLVGISILVACATFVAYLHMPAESRHDQPDPSTPSPGPTTTTAGATQQSNSFAGLMWAFLCASLGVSTGGGGRNRGSGGGAGSRGLASRAPAVSPNSIQLPLLRRGVPFSVSTTSTSVLAGSASVTDISGVPEMKVSSPIESPDTTPKARPVTLNGNAHIPSISLSASSDGDEQYEDDDTPPAFPAINSVQRARSGGNVNSTLINPGLRKGNSFLPSSVPLRNPMPPPPLPQIRGRNPRTLPTTLMASPAALARAGVSGQRSSPYLPGTAGGTALSTNGGLSSVTSSSSSLALPPTHTAPPAKPNRKVILEPGHSPLDWARLCRTAPPEQLRGPDLPPGLLRVTPSMLARYGRPRYKPKSKGGGNTGTNGDVNGSGSEKEMVWMALEGKVYNITAYIPFHPGGEGELLRAAGKDGTSLFMKTHSWVNVEGMLGGCLVGILVPEDEGDGKGGPVVGVNGTTNGVNGDAKLGGVRVGPGLEDVD